MSQHHSLPAPATPIREADYQAIEAAVMETERGRWFLQEYAERNRHANTEEVIGAVQEISDLLKTQQENAPPIHRFKIGLADMAEAIEKTKREIAQMRSDRTDRGRVEQASAELDAIVGHTEEATSEILSAAESIQEIGFEIREDETLDTAKLDLIDERATEIFMACSFQDLTGQRISKVVNVLRFLEIRVNAMMEIWGFTEEEIKKTLSEVDHAEEEHSEDNPPMLGPMLPGQGVDQNSVDSLFDVIDPDDVFDVHDGDETADSADVAFATIEAEPVEDDAVSETGEEAVSVEAAEPADAAADIDDEDGIAEATGAEDIDDDLDAASPESVEDMVDDDGVAEAAAETEEPQTDGSLIDEDESNDTLVFEATDEDAEDGETPEPLPENSSLDVVEAVAELRADQSADDDDGVGEPEVAETDAASPDEPEETVAEAAEAEDAASEPEPEPEQADETKPEFFASIAAIEPGSDESTAKPAKSRLEEELKKWREDIASEKTVPAAASVKEEAEPEAPPVSQGSPEKSFGRRSGFTIEKSMASTISAALTDDGAIGEVTEADSRSALDTLRAFSDEAEAGGESAPVAEAGSPEAEDGGVIPSMIYGSGASASDDDGATPSEGSEAENTAADQQPLPRIRRHIKGEENASDLLAQYGEAERHVLFGR